MKMTKKNKIKPFLLFGTLFVCILIGKSFPVFSAEVQGRNPKVKIEKIAVLPAIDSSRQSKIEKVEKELDCQLLGLCSRQDKPSISEKRMKRPGSLQSDLGKNYRQIMSWSH